VQSGRAPLAPRADRRQDNPEDGSRSSSRVARRPVGALPRRTLGDAERARSVDGGRGSRARRGRRKGDLMGASDLSRAPVGYDFCVAHQWFRTGSRDVRSRGNWREL